VGRSGREQDGLRDSPDYSVDERDEPLARADELTIRISDDRQQRAFLDRDPVAVDGEGGEREHDGTGPASQSQASADHQEDPGAIRRVADQRIGTAANYWLVWLGADIAGKRSAEQPKAVAAKEARGNNGGSAQD